MSGFLECSPCGHMHQRPASVLDQAHHCPECNERICGWCGEDLSERSVRTKYCDSTCNVSASHLRRGTRDHAGRRLGSAASHPIQRVREEQEAWVSHWSQIAREGIVRALLARPDGFHADDLERLDIPEDYRNVIGSQIAKLVNQRYMVSCGERASRVASRNAAKSKVYRLTELGREKLIDPQARLSTQHQVAA